jgi:6-phosphogluconolactonase
MPAVYVQTNDVGNNEVVAFRRSDDGSLASLGRFSTGGRGTGEPHLPSQGSVLLTDDGRWLLVANAGSDEVSVFAVESDGLRLTGRIASGGRTPTSVGVRGELVYVLNNGTPNVCGFELSGGALMPLEDSERPLSGAKADPAQVAVTVDGSALIVTERGTNSISSYALDGRGYAEGAELDQVVGPDALRFCLHDRRNARCH